MIGLDALRAGVAPYLLWLKIGAVAIFVAGLAYWHVSAVKDAREAGMQDQRAIYDAAYIKESNEAKESAEEVRRLNEKSRAALVAGRDADADRLRKQLAAARNSGPAVQAGATSDQRTGDTGRTDNNAEARRTDQIDNAISDAVAEYRAALLSCGQSVGNVADKIK